MKVCKVCINDHGHITKMAAMAINSKPLKIFFSRTRRPTILKLGMKHQGEKLYKVYINHEPILRQGQRRSPMHLYGENCQNVI